VISVFLLLPLYAVGIQVERGGAWLLLWPITGIALVLDVILNFTELALLTLDLPAWGEWTFSKRLSRLKAAGGWRGDLARYIKRGLDAIAPSGLHIE
jgi:hypothetical protein